MLIEGSTVDNASWAVTCLDDNQIILFLEGQLQGKSAAAVAHHLDACNSCRRLLAQVAMSMSQSLPLPAEIPAQDSEAEPTQDMRPLGRLIGRQIGNFRVTGLIGAGGMGVVFSGVHVLLQHKVAIKVMQLQGLSHELLEQATARFFTEAKALVEIQSSPHVIQIHDFGRFEEGNFYYYVMELLEGHTLEQELQRRERFSLVEALPYLEQICAGLSAVHQHQILHRDLKPANIFILRGEPLRLKLLDFGLAKRLHVAQQMTADGLGMGSPLYAAPELVLGDQTRLGPQTDIYALGVLTYRMLAGKMPWTIPAEAGPYKLFLLPTEHDPTPLRTHRPDLPLPFAAVIEAALSRAPEERPATAEAYYAALSQSLAIASSPRVSAAPAPPAERLPSPARVAAPLHHRRMRWGLFGLLGLLLATGLISRGVVYFSSRRPPAPPSGATFASFGAAKAINDLLHAAGAEVAVSSTVQNAKDRPEHLIDGDLATAWNSRSGELQGAWVAFRVPSAARISSIRLTAGFTKKQGNQDLFLQNHRITRVRVSRPGQVIGTYALDPERRQLQDLPVRGAGGEYVIEVLETVAGTKRDWREVCISELQVPGQLPPELQLGPAPSVTVGEFAPSSGEPCPEELAATALGSAACVASCILADKTPPEQAAALAREGFAYFGLPARRPLAVAANTRGYRLHQAQDNKGARSLFLTAAELDKDYGMPRYNAARVFALQGDAAGALNYLHQLKQIGWAQQGRLRQAFKDEAFKLLYQHPAFTALYCYEHGQQLKQALKRALAGQPLRAEQLDLLGKPGLLLVSSAIYARHGRLLESEWLNQYFYGPQRKVARRLRVDPRYTDAKLSPIDWANAHQARALLEGLKPATAANQIACTVTSTALDESPAP